MCPSTSPTIVPLAYPIGIVSQPNSNRDSDDEDWFSSFETSRVFTKLSTKVVHTIRSCHQMNHFQTSEIDFLAVLVLWGVYQIMWHIKHSSAASSLRCWGICPERLLQDRSNDSPAFRLSKDDGMWPWGLLLESFEFSKPFSLANWLFILESPKKLLLDRIIVVIRLESSLYSNSMPLLLIDTK